MMVLLRNPPMHSSAIVLFIAVRSPHSCFDFDPHPSGSKA
jgi:hypothetical protein